MSEDTLFRETSFSTPHYLERVPAKRDPQMELQLVSDDDGVANACRRIRARWSREERRRRRQVAEAMQQRLRRLLAAA